MQTSWAVRGEDLAFDKTDDKDAVLIAPPDRAAALLGPEPVDESWGRCGIWVPAANSWSPTWSVTFSRGDRSFTLPDSWADARAQITQIIQNF